MTKHKDKVSWLVLILIAALTLASILNIIQKSGSYHRGYSAILVGVGFGLSLAVTTYIVMIAESAKTRWVAATFAVVFAGVSATIQTALYLDEHAPFAVALAYGVGVPGFEAALAILEALLRREVVAEISQVVTPVEPVADAPAARPAKATRHPATASEPPPPPATTTKATVNLRKVVEVAGRQPFATDAELAALLTWSETSARRYRTMAEGEKLIHRNGDGRYHVGRGSA